MTAKEAIHQRIDRLSEGRADRATLVTITDNGLALFRRVLSGHV